MMLLIILQSPDAALIRMPFLLRRHYVRCGFYRARTSSIYRMSKLLTTTASNCSLPQGWPTSHRNT